MFFLRKPSQETIKQLMQIQTKLEPSYSFIGATHPHNYNPPKGYNLDHNRICLGQGEAVFMKAIANLEKWKMYQTSWTFIQNKTLKESMVNALLARHFGFYSIQVIKVVYLLREPKRVAFAIGTLPSHAEQGEERFMVECLPDDSVWFDILAFSKPRHILAKLGYPLSRYLQGKFARDSLKIMQVL